MSKEAPKSAKDLLKEINAGIITNISINKVSIVSSLYDLEESKGDDDYCESLLAVVTAFDTKPYKKGKTGIPISKLKQVFPDHALLVAARKTLRESCKIVETDMGQTTLIKLPGPKAQATTEE